MEETIRDDGFEATFVVSAPRAEAWRRLQRASPAVEGMGEAGPGQWWIPGIEGSADEVEVVPEQRLRARKAEEPCKGTEIVITMTDDETGTRITIVQSGFGTGFASSRPWLVAGWRPILADLVVYFERGVALGRHAVMWSSFGCDVEETDEGLLVAAVSPDGLAAAAGLRTGDLLLHVMGAPVLTVADLSVLTRGPLRPGAEVKVRYLRGTEVLRGTGRA